MSSTSSLDQAEYRSCDSRPDSPGGGVDTTPEGGDPSVNPESRFPLSDVSNSLANHASVDSSNARQTSFLNQLTTWLTLGGFRTDSKLPAAFQENMEVPHHRSTDFSNDDSISTERALVKRTLARHDEAYVCGLRRDIFTNLLDHARNMLEHHAASSRTSSNPASTDSKPASKTYMIEDEDILCVVAHVVRVMEALHQTAMLASKSQDARVDKVGPKPNNLDPTAILPRSLKTQSDTGKPTTLSESHITAGTSAGPVLMPHQPPRMHAGEAIQEDAGASELDVRADGSDRGQQAEVAEVRTSTSTSRSYHASTGFKHEITSFPALRKRQGTSDWLIPPAATPGLKEVVSQDDLYSIGVDAHQGGSASHRTQATIPAPWPTLRVEAGNLAFRTPSYALEEGEQVVEPPHNAAASKLAGTAK
ncbi:hypothetical protein DL546_000860 [Coniochaeta pulveracea]|uniref:Uncharacterized protein n=1 Tax=Coniochaeta pulveracea TaxID=177199 RepID=A0A420Y514_9PEZI|nr:hypothetical protein DL546_000860 [Coniochaeta pulveracea]